MVSQRAKEAGVRIAVGARPGQILWETLGSGGRLTLMGAVAGMALAALASRFAGTLVYGARRMDTVAYLGALSVLIAGAFLACLIPTRRAISIDPAQALREA